MRTRPGGGTDHVPVTGPSEPQVRLDSEPRVRLDAVPRRLRPLAEAVLAHRLGGLLLRVAGELVRVQIFDRAMTLAAQAFTSIFPILIMLGALSGASVQLPGSARAGAAAVRATAAASANASRMRIRRVYDFRAAAQ